MVNHDIHDDAHTTTMGFFQQLFEILHRAKVWINRVIIGNVIPIIDHRRLINRRQPNRFNPKLLQIIELADNALQIAHALRATIAKTFRINLINCSGFPPRHGLG
ncbi:Uncharacterised protein [Vibrio cholerae]|uniref:Uncharacterized protein n=1 Tax=Vibrio cholerae TaxID=666 RepID=A0A656AXI3_VIBCL|nr:Uncharacterised protein [Vibrio cholerae]CSD15287.1 Uncharacterised protein [Vibrio cholerae]CSD47877.1 Uncharacterised protein [Vibrio cholerae]